MGAAYYGHEAAVRLLLDSGADINVRGRDGATALMYAATADRKEVVRLLLDRGAYRWIRDRYNLTPYEFALSIHNLPMARLLDQRDMVATLPDEVCWAARAAAAGAGKTRRGAGSGVAHRTPPHASAPPKPSSSAGTAHIWLPLIHGTPECRPRVQAVVPACQRQGSPDAGPRARGMRASCLT